MGLVLEKQQPGLRLAVGLHGDFHRAGVDLLAFVQLGEFSGIFQVFHRHGSQVHQANRLGAAQFPAGSQVILIGLFQQRVLKGGVVNNGIEGRMAAMVAPIGIEDAQFRFVGIAALGAEILHHLAQVVVVHRQPHPLAVGLQLRIRHLPETLQYLDGLHLGLLHVAQHREVFLARLHGVDVIMADLLQLGIGHLVLEQQQLRRTDVDLSLGVDQPHTVDSRRGALVELPGQVLHGDVFAAREVARVGHGVGHHLAENRVAALLQQFPAEAEQVVDAEQAHFAQFQIQVGIQLPAQALGLDPEAGQFFYENTIVSRVHFILFALILQIVRPIRRHTPRHPYRQK